MGAFLRSILAVIVGTVVAMLVVTGFDLLSHILFPLPAGVDPTNAAELMAIAGQIPLGAFAVIITGWGVGSFIGAWLAGRIAGRGPLLHGMIVTVLLLIAGVTNLLLIPHPIWVWALGIAAFILGGYAGARLAAGRKPQAAPPVIYNN
jgi:hypothetical protein